MWIVPLAVVIVITATVAWRRRRTIQRDAPDPTAPGTGLAAVLLLVSAAVVAIVLFTDGSAIVDWATIAACALAVGLVARALSKRRTGRVP